MATTITKLNVLVGMVLSSAMACGDGKHRATHDDCTALLEAWCRRYAECDGTFSAGALDEAAELCAAQAKSQGICDNLKLTAKETDACIDGIQSVDCKQILDDNDDAPPPMGCQGIGL